MAVGMATQNLEGEGQVVGVAFEEKMQPVPSSERMALDLEINGTSYRDEPTLETASPDNITLTTPIKISPEFTSSPVDVNGVANMDAFSANQATIALPPIVDLKPLESQAAEISISAPDPAPLDDNNTTSTATTDLPQLPTCAEEQPETSALLESADSAVDMAVDDLAGSSTVPPVVEAQESDLREATSSFLAPVAPMEPMVEDQNVLLEFNDGSDPFPAEKAEEPTNSTVIEAEVVVTTLEQPVPVLPTPPPADTQSPLISATNLDTPTPPEVEPEAPADITMDVVDTVMADAPEPPQPTKIAREREDDEHSQPSAKRTKTEDDSLMSEAPESIVTAPLQNGEASANIRSENSKSLGTRITPHETKEIIKIVKNIARTGNGKNFRASVDQLWPAFAEAYSEKIKNKIDLGIMEKKLRENSYSNMAAFTADVHLLYANALAFNGLDHTITNAAREVRDNLLNKTAVLPPAPIPAPKKEKKAKRSTPLAEAAPRVTAPQRQSRGAGSAGDARPAPTFALDPQTSTPLIRRDSTKGDGGRPKREIHPPKNKDLPYMNSRPKSKKFATELRFCEDVLNELKKPKHSQFSNAFMAPVDPVALGIPNYFSVIKQPMDIQTVSNKLSQGSYTNSKEFEKDVSQIFANCYKFNPQGNIVREMGKQFEAVFQAAWGKKDKWISDHAPAVASPSSSPVTEDEEESEDEESEPTAVAGASQVAARLIEEQTKLINLMSSKKPDQSLIQMQQDMVQIIQKRVQEEADKANASKKPKAPKAAKKAAPVKKAVPASKKSSNANRQSSKYLGTLEKEVISAGLTSLPDEVSGSVLDMIKRDQPSVDVGDDGTLELDIDMISVPTLWKIYDLIMLNAPEVEANIRKSMQERDAPRALAKPATKKKNKPMSKTEQERKIEQLKSSVQEFERQGSGSQEPVLPTVEQQDESSGDEDSDSEEE